MSRAPITLTVLAGSFANQREAFGAIVEAAGLEGVNVDLADVDVICAAANVRLAHYFRPAIVAQIQDRQGDDDTLILLRACELTQKPRALTGHPLFRRLGVFAGVDHDHEGA